MHKTRMGIFETKSTIVCHRSFLESAITSPLEDNVDQWIKKEGNL